MERSANVSATAHVNAETPIELRDKHEDGARQMWIGACLELTLWFASDDELRRLRDAIDAKLAEEAGELVDSTKGGER